jgi:hypothetical protein
MEKKGWMRWTFLTLSPLLMMLQIKLMEEREKTEAEISFCLAGGDWQVLSTEWTVDSDGSILFARTKILQRTVCAVTVLIQDIVCIYSMYYMHIDYVFCYVRGVVRE